MQVITTYALKEGVGKTTITLNLADSLAKLGKKIVIADFNLFHPTFNTIFPPDSLPRGYISDYFTKYSISLDDILVERSITTEKNYNIGILYAHPNPFENSRSNSLQNLSGIAPENLVPRLKRLIYELSILKIDYFIINNVPGMTKLSILALLVSDIVLLIHAPSYFTKKGDYNSIKERIRNLKKDKTKERKIYLIPNLLPEKPSENQKRFIENWINKFSSELKLPILESFNFNTELSTFKENPSIWFPLNSFISTKIEYLAKSLDIV